MRKRIRAFEDQLPDLLITIAASLKAGHSFKQGLQAVVDEGHPPANAEIRRVLTEASLGRSMDDGLAEMADRVGSANFESAITAVTIQRQVGGSPRVPVRHGRRHRPPAPAVHTQDPRTDCDGSDVGVHADRDSILHCGCGEVLNRSYMHPLYFTTAGRFLIGLGLVMMMLGSLVLKKIVSFRG